MMRRKPIFALLAAGIMAVWVTVFAFLSDLPAQVARKVDQAGQAEQQEAQEAIENVFLPPDRRTLRKMSEAVELSANRRYAEAVRNLGEILESAEDYFQQTDKKSPLFRSLKSQAEQLLGKMPREARELYELQYGPQARRLLAEALESGDVGRLAEVTRRFFHTRAGQQATYLLGLHHFDHGRPLAGALLLQRVRENESAAEEFEPSLSLTLAACWLKAGNPDRARQTLIALRQRNPSLRAMVAGREVPLFADNADAVEWLTNLIGSQPPASVLDDDRWLMFRGNPARNAATVGGAPLLNLRWRVPIAADPLAEGTLRQYQRMYAEQNSPTIPALHPLAVGDVLLLRTMQNLQAVDFNTGKRLWEIPTDEPDDPTARAPADAQARLLMAAANAGQRMWSDLTYGTLSSDGQLVFSVEEQGGQMDEETGMNVAIVRGRAGIVNVRVRRRANPGDAAPNNRLTAHDIRTGKLIWEIGGPAGPSALNAAEHYFLGPPLPLMGQLYVLAEYKGQEVRLLALDAATGETIWSQQLSIVEQSVAQDPERAMRGAAPSYADGVLVCPTSTGAVVGVDLATRSLLWGYCYSVDRANPNRNGMVIVGNNGNADEHWTDCGVLIRDGRAIVSPWESDWLYCLNLIDGELLWKSPRQNDLYTACADREKVVLVGTNTVRALKLGDGSPLWTLTLPDGATPSGRGFLSAGRYYLPTSRAEVLSIDLSSGKIAAASKSRTATVPGNLICHKGLVISQGLEGVDAFHQLDLVAAEVQKRLAANPDDAEALALSGEVLLDSNKRAEALAALRRSYQLAPNPRPRELLRDTLLEELRRDFAAARNTRAEIEGLLDTPRQWANYLRLTANGLSAGGELSEAFDCYRKLIDLEPGKQPLDQIDQGWLVRRDRWIAGRLAALRKNAQGDAAAKLDQFTAEQLKAATAAEGAEKLRQFVECYGQLPAVESARSELVHRLQAEGRRLEAELASSGEVTPAPAEPQNPVVWPAGKVDVAITPTKDLSGMGTNMFLLPLRGQAGSALRDLSIRFDFNRRGIAAFDEQGRERWQVSLLDENNPQFNFHPQYTHAHAAGNLLLVSLGLKVAAIDPLGIGAADAARLLWVQDITNPTADVAAAQGLGQLQLPGGMLPRVLQMQLNRLQYQTNVLGVVGKRCVVVQRLRSIVGLDPISGETLWVRQDFPAVCDIFGDDEYVFVLTTDEEEISVLRADDGELVGKRKIPRYANQQQMPNGKMQTVYSRLEGMYLAVLGRNLLYWWQDGNNRVLKLIDPLDGRNLWERKFSVNSRACMADEEALAIFSPSGQFTLISLPDGRQIAEKKLDAEPSLTSLELMKADEGYFLVVGGNPGRGNMPPVQPMPNHQYRTYNPIISGKLYAIDRQGNFPWPQPTEISKQLLLPDQPRQLPLVIFACQHYLQKGNQGQWKPQVMCVDKRSGRVVYKQAFDGHTPLFRVGFDQEKKTVTLTMQKDTITLTYTDAPIPPAPAAGAKPAKPAARSEIARAMWDAIRESFGLGPDQSDQDDE
jgi:outer membrane protein assembly factor BamB